MKEHLKIALLGLLVVVASGCATISQPVDYSGVNKPSARVGVLISEPAPAAAAYTGSIGLLDLAIIASVNSGLNDHLETLVFDDYLQLPSDIKVIGEQQGHEIIIIEEPLELDASRELTSHKEGVGQNDYSAYQEQHGIEYLLVLRLTSIGTTRPYYGPIPTAAPVTQATVWGELVDLSNNNVLWYRNVVTSKVIPEPWDESDNGYPNLTNSVYQALNDAMETIKTELADPEARRSTVSLNEAQP